LVGLYILDNAYKDNYGNRLRLEQDRLIETPGCWADANLGRFQYILVISNIWLNIFSQLTN